MRTRILIAAAVLNAPTALAQDDPGSGSSPEPEVLRPAPDPEPIEPIEPNVSTPHPTGLTGGRDWIESLSASLSDEPPKATIPEGAFVLARPGRLVPAPNGRMIFVPDHESRLAGEGPMLLLPCAQLEQLEQVWNGQRVELTGEVFVAHGRRHLLIVDSAYLSDATPEAQEAPEPVETETGSEETQTDPEASLDEDPEVDALLRELGGADDDSDRSELIASLNDPRLAAQDDGTQEAPPELAFGVHEGTILVRRKARMNRTADGSWSVIFDNDDPDSLDALELTLFPCVLMQKLENIAIARGPETEFIISGRVYVHSNRGYLLPTFAQVTDNPEINAIQ